MSFLEVKNLDVTYLSRGEEVHAVQNVSFTMEAGEVVSLVGESGSGKSSVAMAVGRLLDYAPCRVTGSVVFEGKPVFEMNPAAIQTFRKTEVAYVFQEPAASLNPVFTVRDQVEEIWDHRDEAKVLELLSSVQLSDPERVSHSYPHELSGGMKQRVMIAMALAKQPRLFVADEPTTALDATVQKEVLGLLLDLKKKKSLTLLFITHDLNIAVAISDCILIMKDGQIVEEIRDVKNLKAQHPYTQKLFRASLLHDEPKHYLDV